MRMDELESMQPFYRPRMRRIWKRMKEEVTK